MAEKRANQSMAYRREPERYYIDGNTARRLNEQPETPKKEEIKLYSPGRSNGLYSIRSVYRFLI